MTRIDSPATASTLERLVGDANVFADEYWGVRPLLRRAAAPGEPGELLDVETVEELLADTLRSPAFRLVRDGATLPRREYTRRVRIGGSVVDDAADVERIAGLVAGGASLVVQSLERYSAPLHALCADLQGELGHPVQANAYLTPPAAAGLQPHRDRHDVIVVQLDGTKTWDVEGLGAVELARGDVLYLPAGTEHGASTGATMSLHVTLGVLSVTMREVARRLVDAADATLDRPLPLRFAEHRDLLIAGVEDVKADLLAAIATVDAAAIADGLVELASSQRRDRQRVTGRLRLAADPGELTAATPVERRPGATMSVRDDTGGDAVVELARCRLRLPGFTLPALRHVAAHETFCVGELPGLDDADRAVLVRRLVREGLLVPVSRSPEADRPRRVRT